MMNDTISRILEAKTVLMSRYGLEANEIDMATDAYIELCHHLSEHYSFAPKSVLDRVAGLKINVEHGMKPGTFKVYCMIDKEKQGVTFDPGHKPLFQNFDETLVTNITGPQ